MELYLKKVDVKYQEDITSANSSKFCMQQFNIIVTACWINDYTVEF